MFAFREEPRMSRVLAIVLVAVLTLVAPHGRAQQKDKDKVDAPSQPNEAMVMQVKLKRSQTLLEALAKEDYKTLEENAESLVRISDSTAFLRAYKTAEYEFQAQVFRRSAVALATKAKDKSLDGATLAYTEMTLSCVKCHAYFRTQKKD
jgi:cytochrome c556